MIQFTAKIKTFFAKPFWGKYSTLLGLWLIIAVVSWLMKNSPERCNNFLIFRDSFLHLWEQLPLYIPYPEQYGDVFLYGPSFPLLMAPFAAMPLWLGLLCWHVGLALALYFGVRTLPFERRKAVFIYWFCAHELLTALFMSQFNVAVAALIILSFALIEREKEPWAALCIVAGLFFKIYGIVGLAFFFFSKHKLRFILSCLGWSVLFFVAPMVLSGADYVLGQYSEWFSTLGAKDGLNLFSPMQNISFLGMVRKISGCPDYSDLWLIAGGLLLFGLPYLRFGQYKQAAFRQTLLASVLLFAVLFSTGSESSSYIIALVGAALWYVAAPWKRNGWDVALMVFAFVLTSMSPSDLFPAWVRQQIVQPYALKALPCVIIWLKLTWEMVRRDYSTGQLTD